MTARQQSRGGGVARVAVNDRRLTDELARRVMNWGVHADRYVKPGRTWIAVWRFQPLRQVDNAFALLERSQSKYCIQLHPRRKEKSQRKFKWAGVLERHAVSRRLG
jgi:hypothetical protein